MEKKHADENDKTMHDFIGKQLGKTDEEIAKHWEEVKDNYPNVRLYRLKKRSGKDV